MPSRPSLLSESLFGEAIARSDLAALLIRDEAIIAANDAACRLTGYASDELFAVSVSELSGPRDEAQEAERQRRREAAERGEWQSGVGQVVRKNGELRAVRYLTGATEVGSTSTFLVFVWELEAEGETGEREAPTRRYASRGSEAPSRGPKPGRSSPAHSAEPRGRHRAHGRPLRALRH